MKKHVFLILLTLLLFAAPSLSEDFGRVKLTAGSWVPFTGQNLKHGGIAAKIVADAFAKEGIKTEFYFRPWGRAFSDAKTNQYNGSILWRRTPEREKEFYYSDPVIKVDVVFFHLKSNTIEWDTLEDLKKYKLGTVTGLKYQDDFDKAIQTGMLAVEQVTSQRQNFSKLLKGRIDITPVVHQSGYATINHYLSVEEAKLFTHNTRPLATPTLHLILSKNNPENKSLIESFNKGLSQMIKADEIDY